MAEYHDPYMPPEASLTDPKIQVPLPKDAPEGIGGWLIVPLIGLTLTPILNLLALPDLLAVLEPATWQSLTSSDSSSYHVLWMPAIFLEIAFTLFMIVFPVYLLWCVMQKFARVPKLFIFWYVVTFGLQFLDTVAISILAESFSGMGEADSYKEVGRAFFALLIWVPYFQKSERVKNTFVN